MKTAKTDGTLLRRKSSNILIQVLGSQMKKAKIFTRTAAVFLFVSAIASSARAGEPFLEPYVGIGQMVFAIYNSYKNDFEDKDIATGFVLGIKGGYNFTQRYFAALDYQTAGPFKFGRTVNDMEITMTMLGAGVGLDMDFARYWLGYYPSQSLTDAKTGGLYKGDAYKIGFGLKVTKNIHANLDVVFNNIYIATGTTTTQIKAQTAFASISLPVPLK